jgi:phosphoribosylformylglycinamidine cyclo-ligase
VPRILPKRCRIVIDRDSWKVPDVFTEVQRRGGVPEAEMWRTFNMGIGMVVVIRPNSLNLARRLLPQARLIGEVKAGRPEVELR